MAKKKVYLFEQFMEEHYPKAVHEDVDSLIKTYGLQYEMFCHNNGFEIEPLKQLEPVHVVAIKGGRIVTSTSCYRMDAQHYAQYYRSIGYKARVMTDEEMAAFDETYRKQCEDMQIEMEGVI